MITFFACPKPFKDKAGIHQENAIKSWEKIPGSQIILLGNEYGIKEFSESLGIMHIPDIAYNETGTPLLDSIFKKAEAASESEMLCFINSDIILFHEFTAAADKSLADSKRFLMVGRRCCLDVDEKIEFDEGWEPRYRELARKIGLIDPYTAIDYFLYPRGFLDNIKPFAIGRAAYDNWILWSVRQNPGAKLIDATDDILAIHQKHEYKHLKGGHHEVIHGKEAERNRELAGGYRCMYNILDSTHVLKGNEIRTANAPKHLYRRIYQMLRKLKHKIV